MSDDLDRSIADALRRGARDGFDANRAAAAFAVRAPARVRRRRTAAAVLVGAGVVAAVVAPALGRGLGSAGRDAVGLASSSSPSTEVPDGHADSETPRPAMSPSQGASGGATPPGPKPSATQTTTSKPTPPPSRGPRPYPSPSRDEGAPPVARVEDSGRTYTIRLGEGFVVDLDGDLSAPWSEIVASDERVLAGETRAVDGDQLGKFVARAMGETTLSSVQHPACRSATPPCAAPSRAWEVRVVVIA